MSAEDLERYETEIELQLYQEYRAVLAHVQVRGGDRATLLSRQRGATMEAKGEGDRTYFEINLGDAWVWDMYRPARFVSSVRVVTFKDVNVEELPEKRAVRALGGARGAGPPGPARELGAAGEERPWPRTQTGVYASWPATGESGGARSI